MLQRIKPWANHLSAKYLGSPVYLVGGALKQRDPRDIDIVVIMPDDLFWRAYIWPEGTYAEWGLWAAGTGGQKSRSYARWLRDCAKQGLWLTNRIGGPLVDFKTQPESFAKTRFPKKPRMLLSTLELSSSSRR